MPASGRRGHVPVFGSGGVRPRVCKPRRCSRPEAYRMSPQHRLVVDRIKCDGRGLCAELLPELIRLDDWGYPIVKSESVPCTPAPARPAGGRGLPGARHRAAPLAGQKMSATVLGIADDRALGSSLRVVVTRPKALVAAKKAVDEVVRAMDFAASRFREDSELSMLNARPDQGTIISPLP